MKPQLVLGLALVLSGNGDAAIINPNAPEGGRTMVSESLSRDLQPEFRSRKRVAMREGLMA